MAAADPCKGLLTKYPPNSPERQAQIDKCFEKKRKQNLKNAAKKPAPTTTTKPKEGTGGSNDPAWGHVGSLVKNGLPG